MKKFLLVFAMMVSTLSVVNVSQANASCNAENPCGTWAVIDSQGVVKNVIVCQESVCGANGAWGGKMPDDTLFPGYSIVPQVAPNPVTHTPLNTGSYIGNSDHGTEVVYSDNKFTINENIDTVKTFTEIDNETTIISEVKVPIASRSFTYDDTIGKTYGNVEMKTETFNESKPTVLTVKNTNLINTIQESASFNERKTAEQIEEHFIDNNLNLMLSKIQTLISLLGTWVK